MKWNYLLFLVVITSFSTFAQIDDSEEEIIIENAVQNSDEEFDNENIIEDLQFLIAQPIVINDTTANYDLLFQYGLLTPLQARQIQQYVTTYGEFLTTTELLAVPSLSKQQIEAILPYVSIQAVDLQEELTLIDQFKNSISRLILRDQFVTEQQAGYAQTDSTASKFAGNAHHLYMKFRHKYRDQLSIGFLADKDAGEAFFTGENSTGFDFYSAHLKFKPKNKLINQINLGDYEVKIGQGLIQWNGFSLGKGADATTVFLKSPILREYTSSNEINFLRGLAGNFNLSPKLNATIWASHKAMDGNQELNDSLETIGKITSLPLTGYHRTAGEIADKNSTTESTFGANVEYSNDWLKVGITGQQRNLSDSLVYRKQEYQRFYPKGNQFNHAGLHYSIVKNKSYLFGETAITENFALATVNGIQHFFKGGAKGTLVYRNYAKNYQSFYANGFSENTAINNEEGLYAGLAYSPIQKLTLQAYYDTFRFPWKKFRVSKPSSGNEYFFQATYQPEERIELEARSRFEQKEIDQAGNALPTKQLLLQKRYTNRLEFRYRPNSLFYFKSRVGHSFYEAEEKEHGVLLFQDVVYQFPTTELTLYGRFSTFKTDSFDSRVYAYENDLLYNFSVPAMYGEGVRWYAMASYSPIPDVKCWVKGSQTIFSDRETISSGNTEIDGNTRTDIKLQVQWTF